MDCRKQSSAGSPPRRAAAPGFKKNSAGVLSHLEQIWSDCFPSFEQLRVAERAKTLSLSALLCLGRHTVTGLLTTSGSQFHDWSADYRLFSQDRLPITALFSVIRRAALSQLAPQAPVCAVLDDTLVRRGGTHTPGVSWRRDPLGPRFQNNFVRAQRFLQVSVAMPCQGGTPRLVPIQFLHAPTATKPSKKASKEQLQQYRADCRAGRLSLRAAQQIRDLRAALD